MKDDNTLRKSGKKTKTALTSKIRFNLFSLLLKFKRTFPAHANIILKSIGLSNLLDSMEKLSPLFPHSADKNIVKEWIEFSKEDLNASRRLYGAEDGLSLYHLQQGVEKLSKATLIFIGMNERKIAGYKHKPEKFVVDILELEGLREIITDKFPFKHIKRPKFNEEKIEKLKNSLKSGNKSKVLEDSELAVKLVLEIASRIGDSKEFKKKISKMYNDDLPKGERRKLANFLSSYNLNMEKVFDIMGEICWILASFLLVIILLLMHIWPFESITRYPDEKRNIKKEFNEFMLYKHFNEILTFLESYVRILQNVVDRWDAIINLPISLQPHK